MGLKGVPGNFQRPMTMEVLHKLIGDICEVHLDDVFVYGTSEDEYVQNVEKVLERFLQHSIIINQHKCKLGLNEVEYIGHTIGHNGNHFTDDKLRGVFDAEHPRTEKELKSFLIIFVGT